VVRGRIWGKGGDLAADAKAAVTAVRQAGASRAEAGPRGAGQGFGGRAGISRRTRAGARHHERRRGEAMWCTPTLPPYRVVKIYIYIDIYIYIYIYKSNKL
jgi:hypothetical protein